MKNIAIITVRGGSKRIPRKNIKEFCGKPIIAYSIEAALNSGVFDTVMVSTDDEEIAEIAKKYGAEVPFMRSAATSNDFATTTDVLNEVINEYRKIGQEFNKMCCIYPTAPFVTSDKLKEGMEILDDSEIDSVIPVVAFSFPPKRGVIVSDKYIKMIYPEHRYTRSQDLIPEYHDAGQFYCVKVDAFCEYGDIITKKTAPLILSESEVQDIDTLEDWKIAEMKYKILHFSGMDGK